jgi:hypothetical protein
MSKQNASLLQVVFSFDSSPGKISLGVAFARLNVENKKRNQFVEQLLSDPEVNLNPTR